MNNNNHTRCIIQQKRHARFGFYNIVSMVIALEIILGGNKSPKMFDGAGAITILKLIYVTYFFKHYLFILLTMFSSI